MSRIGSSAARVERAASPAGLVGALLLHAGIIAAAFVTWSHSLDIADQSPPVIPVDLVTIGQKTNIAPMVREKPPEPAKQETQTAPVPEPKQVAAPAPQEEAPPPAPEKSAPAPQIVKAPPIVPKFRPQQEEKKDKFDINNIMALLDKRAPAARQAPAGKVGNRAVRGIGAQTAMTMDLVDALRNQIAQCWSPPVGAPHPDQLIVSFELFLNPDGSVAQPPQLTGSSATSGDPFMRAAAEAARRAIYTCAPYKLPGDRFAQWRDITLIFDPRQMVGQ
ncbi:MAG TPA: hypothetical protein VHC42_13230 [Rhizomicrobium sp.]|nr:hypothetical protein [Rhizomicrobium sp.]